MRCEDAQDKFAMYWDMPEDDEERREIEAHLVDCEACAEQFRVWEQSERMIRSLAAEEQLIGPLEHVNRNVMNRIYAEQSWLMPVPGKSYQFSKSFRRNMALIVAACMAMFACAIFVFVFDYRDASTAGDMQQLTGILDTANASGDSVIVTAGLYSEVPVASISDPFVLKVVPTFPQYYVALSLLGLVAALLLLNWLSRTRS